MDKMSKMMVASQSSVVKDNRDQMEERFWSFVEEKCGKFDDEVIALFRIAGFNSIKTFEGLMIEKISNEEFVDLLQKEVRTVGHDEIIRVGLPLRGKSQTQYKIPIGYKFEINVILKKIFAFITKKHHQMRAIKRDSDTRSRSRSPTRRIISGRVQQRKPNLFYSDKGHQFLNLK